MARTDYGAILSTVIKDTSDAVREVNGTSSLIAPNQWGTAIRTMHSDTDYDNVMAQLIEETATGDIASFSDGANDIPLKSLTCAINPVQDLHGQDYPYPSGGGINIWDEVWEVGNIDSSGTDQPTNNSIRSKNYISCIPNTNYYKYIGGSKNGQIFFYDNNKTFISRTGNAPSGVVTSPSNAYFMRFASYSDYGATYKNDISINYPSSDTSYHPYSNICPITGHTELNLVHTGKNLFGHEPVTISYSTYVLNNEPMFLKAGNYTLSFEFSGSNNSSSFRIDDKDGNSIFAVTKTVANGLNYINISLSKDGYFLKYYSNAIGTYSNFQIELGTTATAYEPYTGTTTTTSFGTTVYGGTLDVESGVLTLDKSYVDLGSIEWTPYNDTFYAQIDGAKTPSLTVIADIMCSQYKPETFQTVIGKYADNTIAINNGQSRVHIYDSSKSTMTRSQFKTAMSGIQLVYELATPTTTQLTSQEVKSLLGSNNFYHDCNGQVAVTYRANGQLYVAQHS